MLLTNNKILVRTGSLIQSALFQETRATNYKILVGTRTDTEDGS